MKKTILYICLSALLVAGCYKPEFEQIEREIQSLEQAEIASLNTQLANIRTSLGNLPSLSGQLKEYIHSLEEASIELQGEIAAIDARILELKNSVNGTNNDAEKDLLAKLSELRTSLETELSRIQTALSSLEGKYASLEQQTGDLEVFADANYATLDWVSGTFATIVIQDSLIKEVEGIRAMLDGLESVTVEIDDDIIAFIETEVNSAYDGASEEIARMASDIVSAIEIAITNARNFITGAYSGELSAAISQSEADIMSWVVEEKLSGCYTVAQAEAQISVIQDLLGDVSKDNSFQDQIDTISARIAEAREKISATYTQVITEAISQCEGRIDGELLSKIQSLRDNELKAVEDGMSSISEEVSKLRDKLAIQQNSINTLDQQVKAIQKSIQVLSDLKVSLQEYVEAVKASLLDEDTTSRKALLSLLAKVPDGSALQERIDDLEQYIGTIPTGYASVTDWIEKSNSTIDKTFEDYALITYVEGLQSEIGSLLANRTERLDTLDSRLSTLLDDSKTTIQGWISATLDDYMDALTFDGKLSALETSLKSLLSQGDATLNSNISTLRGQINSAISELESAYKAAIATAITQYNGYVSSEVESALGSARVKVTALDTELSATESIITGIRSDIAELNSRISTAKTDVAALLEFISNSGYSNLKTLVEDILDSLSALPTTYANMTDFNAVKDTVDVYVGTAGKISTFATELEGVEDKIALYKQEIGEYDLEGDDVDVLKAELDTILAHVVTLKSDVDSNATNLSSITGRIEELGGKIESLIDVLNKAVEKIKTQMYEYSSIVYIPVNFQSRAPFAKAADGRYRGSLKFDIRPRSIAPILYEHYKEYVKFYFASTPATRALDLKEFELLDFAYETLDGKDEPSGIIAATVSVKSEDASAFEAGASLVMVVTGSETIGDIKYVYDFASEFVPCIIE